jgi:ferrochelatase
VNEKTAVLLMAYGAAASLDDIPAYLQDIRGGRPATPELIAAVRDRYVKIGGKSPLLEITRAQAAALADKTGLKVHVGMRHSPPTILDAVRSIAREGNKRVVAMPLTPFYSKLSVGVYLKKVEEAVAAVGGGLEVAAVESWNDQPALIEAWVGRLKEGYGRFNPSDRIEVLFTAHSLPEKILKDHDPYPDELKETVDAVARTAGLRDWKFAYQSRGATSEPWLGPDAADVIRASPRKHLLVVPIGFVSDHMETLYDDDILYRELAQSRGMRFERVASLNDDPKLIEAMSDAVAKAAGRR